MRPTFEKTVDILVKAYLNDTLEHGNCCACAVGNIIANEMGFKYGYSSTRCTPLEWTGVKPNWYSQSLGVIESDQSEATGYTVDELTLIEHAFEGAGKYWNTTAEDRMLHGLLSVVDTLAEIHNVDLSVREEAKLLFVKP